MLLKTGIELELLHDEELNSMVEKGLRGGMCQVSMRKAIASNKYMEMLMMKQSHHHTSIILMLIIFMDWQCVRNYLIRK